MKLIIKRYGGMLPNVLATLEADEMVDHVVAIVPAGVMAFDVVLRIPKEWSF